MIKYMYINDKNIKESIKNMSMEHRCKRCGYQTTSKSNLISHFKRKNPCDPVLSIISIQELKDELNVLRAKETTFDCDYCGKQCKTRQSRWNHKQTCKKRTPLVEKLLEEIRLLKSTHITNNNTTNNNTTNNQININISTPPLKEFGFENTDAVPESLISACFLFLRYKDLLENLHCDPNFPENHNVRLKSIKNKTMEIYSNNRWNVVPLCNGVNDLIKNANTIFQKYVRKNKERILEEDMDNHDFDKNIDEMNKIDHNADHDSLLPLKREITAMLETYRNNLTYALASTSQ